MADNSVPSPSNVSVTAPRRRGDLHGHMLTGASWKAISQTTLQVVQIATTAILSRILGPHQFGLVGMVTVFSALIFYFADLSFSAALVQRKVITEAHKLAAFWTSMVGGLTITVGAIALAPLVARFYNTPAVEPLFAVMALNLFILAVGRTQTALLQRDMQFRSLEVRSIISGLAGAVVGISMAIAGFGPWSIVAQVMTISLVRTVLVWMASPWRPSFSFSFEAWRDIRGFSRNLLVANVLYFLNGNADNVIVGRFLGATSLGFYRVSYSIMLMPIQRIVIPVKNVVFPVLSRMEGDKERMLAAWIRINRVIGAITIPALVGLVCTAPDVVAVLLGPKWHAATPIVQVLTVVGMLQASQRINDGVLQACGLTNKQSRFAVIAFVLNLAGFLIGVHWGVMGVAVGAAVANGIVQFPYLSVTAKALDSTGRAVSWTMRWIVLATVVMGFAVLGTREVLVGHLHRPLPRLLVEVAVGTLVYAVAVWVLDRELYRELRSIVRNRVGKVRGGRGGGGGGGRRQAMPAMFAETGSAVAGPAPAVVAEPAMTPASRDRAWSSGTIAVITIAGGVFAVRRWMRRAPGS